MSCLKKLVLVQNLYGLGSGSGPSKFEKSDPDPDKNCPDPQHWLLVPPKSKKIT
jgi:hypothetical protein